MEGHPNIDTDNINNPHDNYKDIIVTPWEVLGDLEEKTYIKLIEKFGTQALSQELIEKFKKLTGEIHPLIKSQYFFSHRDFDWLLTKYENGDPFYLYTGRGPSGSVHLGHLLPWLFTKYLQDKFGSKLLFQLTDDEKFLYNLGATRETISKYTSENILDIIAIGFKPNLTKIIIDTKHINHLYPIAMEIAKKITFSTAKAVFGFTNTTNIGMIGFPPIQAAPCFLPSIIENKPTPVLIPAAIDQDPYWRITRDIAAKLGFYKPAQIHSKFLPSLSRGISKMSSSKPETAIFTTDEPEIVEKKVLSSFTGGQATVSLQKKLGANADICPVYGYLKYFFDNEKESVERYIRCKSGNLLCGECKSDLANNTRTFIIEFKRKREKAKDKVKDFMFD
ncbi:MAG TPA: tryptophan--tRNA ligase [Nitrososphaeraceae archaeon]|jgi:tryptophanyl-tRNA synthetase|nr:tryptophan--tRNA ligase [Nitrososphaeraceae archaeon]